MLHVLVPVLKNLSLMLDTVLGGSVGVAGLMVMLVVRLKFESVMGGFEIPKLGLRVGSKTSVVFREGENNPPVKKAVLVVFCSGMKSGLIIGPTNPV